MSSKMLSPRFRRTRNILLLVIFLLAAVLTVQLLLNLLVMPRMRIGQVLLESTLPLPDEDLLRLGGISGRVNYLTLDENELQANYEASPLIRKAFVEKQFPNTLKIVLYGRKPLGVALLEENGQLSPFIFDDKGVLFYKGAPLEGLDLPVLSGVRFGSVAAGMTLPDALLPLFEDMKQLQDGSPLLFGQISEIRVNKKSDEHFDLTLYFSSYPVPAVTRASLDDSLLKKILLVLDVLRDGMMTDNLEYADFRSGQVVLKMREEG